MTSTGDHNTSRIFLCIDGDEYYRLKGNGLVPKIMVQDYTAAMTGESVISGISGCDEESGVSRTYSTASSLAPDLAPPFMKPVNWDPSAPESFNTLDRITKLASSTFEIPQGQPFLLRLIAFGNGIIPLMPIMIDNDMAVAALRPHDYVQVCPVERVIAGEIEDDPVNPQCADDIISRMIMRVLRLPNPLRRRRRDDPLQNLIQKANNDDNCTYPELPPITGKNTVVLADPVQTSNSATSINNINSVDTGRSVLDSHSLQGLGPVSDASGSAIVLSAASYTSLGRRDSSRSDDIDFKFIDGHGPVLSFRAAPKTPFSKAAGRYCLERNLQGLKSLPDLFAQIIFKRNGDPVDVASTVGELHLQDGEQILVVWSDSLRFEMFQNLQSEVIDITKD